MLLHRSAPLATVDHFNGELLALTSLSAKREGSQKKGAAAADLSIVTKKNKGKVRESPLKTPISTSTTSVATVSMLSSFFSGKRPEVLAADTTAKRLSRIII